MPSGSRAPISFLLVSATRAIGALDLLDRLDEAVDDAVCAAARHEVDDDLGVGGRLADGAVADEVAAQRQAVGQVAVVGDREAAAVELGEERLDVAQDRLAGGRVAHVADGREALQPLDRGAVREAVADEAELALEMEDVAVEGDDAGRLLAAMLEGVQAERGDRRGVRVAVDAEDAAFLAQGVAIEVEVVGAAFARRTRPATFQTVQTSSLSSGRARAPKAFDEGDPGHVENAA